jgi:hypothetical protein
MKHGVGLGLADAVDCKYPDVRPRVEVYFSGQTDESLVAGSGYDASKTLDLPQSRRGRKGSQRNFSKKGIYGMTCGMLLCVSLATFAALR